MYPQENTHTHTHCQWPPVIYQLYQLTLLELIMLKQASDVFFMISFKHLITTAAAFFGFCHQHLCLICTGITASLLQLGMFYPILLIKCCLCSLCSLYWMFKHCLWAVNYFIVSLHLLMSSSFVCDIFTPILYKVFKAWSRPPRGGHHERLYSRRKGYEHLDSQCIRTDWFLVNRPTEQNSCWAENTGNMIMIILSVDFVAEVLMSRNYHSVFAIKCQNMSILTLASFWHQAPIVGS